MKYLNSSSIEAITAHDGLEALTMLRSQQVDVVLLDVTMPGIDGVETLRQLRTFSDVYVIMVSARTEETDKLIGLAVGADDYITKPFSPREVIARINTVLRRPRSSTAQEETRIARNWHANGENASARSGRAQKAATESLEFGDLFIDLSGHEVTLNGNNVELTPIEFSLLTMLANSPGRVYSRVQLLKNVWGYDDTTDQRVVDVHIRNLRKALNDPADNPKIIGTVRSIGYKFLGNK